MRTMFEQVRGWMERMVGQVTAMVDPPLAEDARPLEVHGAIVDAVEMRTEPIGGGRRVLPYDRVEVTVLAREKDERIALQAALAELTDAIRTRLRELRCDLPAGFRAAVRYVKQPPAGWAPEQRFAVSYSSHETAADHPPAPVAPPALHLTVVRGRAMESSYSLTEWRVHIGRTAAPVDSSGRVRQNHVAFVEDDADTHSQSVGRAHASIQYQSDRQRYHVFDDGSRNGTRVTRNGSTLDVVRGDPVGVAIQSGDEIQLGTAAIAVRIDGA